MVKPLTLLHYFVAGVYIAYGIVSWCYFSVAFSGERLADDAAQAAALHALGRQLFTVSPVGVIAIPLGVFVGGSDLLTRSSSVMLPAQLSLRARVPAPAYAHFRAFVSRLLRVQQ